MSRASDIKTAVADIERCFTQAELVRFGRGAMKAGAQTAATALRRAVAATSIRGKRLRNARVIAKAVRPYLSVKRGRIGAILHFNKARGLGFYLTRKQGLKPVATFFAASHGRQRITRHGLQNRGVLTPQDWVQRTARTVVPQMQRRIMAVYEKRLQKELLKRF